MTITWGGIVFSVPMKLLSWDPPYGAAIHAIMKKADPISRPDLYSVLFWGVGKSVGKRIRIAPQAFLLDKPVG
jgi:hypothetical protein